MTLPEKDAVGGTLANLVLEVVQAPEKLAVMSSKSRRLSPADAANLVVATIEQRCQA